MGWILIVMVSMGVWVANPPKPAGCFGMPGASAHRRLAPLEIRSILPGCAEVWRRGRSRPTREFGAFAPSLAACRANGSWRPEPIRTCGSFTCTEAVMVPGQAPATFLWPPSCRRRRNAWSFFQTIGSRPNILFRPEGHFHSIVPAHGRNGLAVCAQKKAVYSTARLRGQKSICD